VNIIRPIHMVVLLRHVLGHHQCTGHLHLTFAILMTVVCFCPHSQNGQTQVEVSQLRENLKKLQDEMAE